MPESVDGTLPPNREKGRRRTRIRIKGTSLRGIGAVGAVAGGAALIAEDGRLSAVWKVVGIGVRNIGSSWRALLLLAGLTLIVWPAIGQRRAKRSDSAEPQLRALALRPIIVSGCVLAIVPTVGITAWLLALAGPDPKLKIQAIQVGLGVCLGAGGAIALLLNARRQWLSEHSQLHEERKLAIDTAHQERVATATEFDANERRITELYIRGAEQLGSHKAPVRLAGLNALDRLGEDNPAHRQTIIDLFCAYLRMPFLGFEQIAAPVVVDFDEIAEPEGRDDKKGCIADVVAADLDLLANMSGDEREELQVRLAAQRVLFRRLQHHRVKYLPRGAVERVVTTTLWEGMDVDLTGAFLVEWSSYGCEMRNASFSNAVFCRGAIFDEVRFKGDCSFDNADFRKQLTSKDGREDASFGEATFCGDASFEGTLFRGNVMFDGSRFDEDVTFRGAIFAGQLDFKEVECGRPVDLSATFGEDVRMLRCVFESGFASSGVVYGTLDCGGSEFNGPLGLARLRIANTDTIHTLPRGYRLDPSTGMLTTTRDHYAADRT